MTKQHNGPVKSIVVGIKRGRFLPTRRNNDTEDDDKEEWTFKRIKKSNITIQGTVASRFRKWCPQGRPSTLRLRRRRLPTGMWATNVPPRSSLVSKRWSFLFLVTGPTRTKSKSYTERIIYPRTTNPNRRTGAKTAHKTNFATATKTKHFH